MPEMTYAETLNQVRFLDLHDQVQLLEELATIVHYKVKAWPKHSILEFQGLGKELWQGIDVEKYIEEDRNSWDR
jgi:hypothetical protein